MAQTHQATERPQGRQLSSASRAESGRRQLASRQTEDIQGDEAQQSGFPDDQGEQGQGGFQGSSRSLSEIAVRSMGRIYDIQIAATRMMLQTQARAASAFGWPDYSGLFRIADERTRRVVSAGTEQFLSLAEKANRTTGEVNRQVGRILESQVVQEAESWQRGLEEIGQQTVQSLEEFRELARQQAEESVRLAESLGEESREAIRQGAEQFRQSVREGAEQGRQVIAQQAEAVREQGEEAGSATRQAGAAASEEAAAGSSQEERQAPKRKIS